MPLDIFHRPLSSIRLSVTDRCNLRCSYCMPEENYRWLARPNLLTFEELVRLSSILHALGARRLRLTGGEPLLRQQLPKLVAMLAQLAWDDLAMTSNGILLESWAEPLRKAGLQRITVSLDTLRPATFLKLSKRDQLDAVLRGLQQARTVNFDSLKIDTVLMRGCNDGELLELVDFARDLKAEIRFIEYMDVAGATQWNPEQVVSQQEILERLRGHYGPVTPLEGRGSAPAQRFRLANGQVLGIIASVTQPFCGDCDRLRVTADGQLLRCLYAKSGLNVREMLRQQPEDGELSQALSQFWEVRRDQGAVERSRLEQRAGYVSLAELRSDPHLEMHTRGG